MKKLFIIGIVLMILFMPLFAQDKWSTGGFVDYKGADWMTWSPYQKNAYLVGFCTGSTAALIYLANLSESDAFIATYKEIFGNQLYLADVRIQTKDYVVNNIVELQMMMDTLIPQYPELQQMYIWQIVYLIMGKQAVGVN